MDTAAHRPARRLLSALLVLALLAVTAVVVVLAREARSDRATARDRQAALTAARSIATALTSISHQTATQDIERILSGATGKLAEQFLDERTPLTELLTSTQSSSRGTVLGAGLAKLEGRSAQVLVVADAAVTNAQSGTAAAPARPTLQRYRMSLQLRKVGERWLVEEILFAGGAGMTAPEDPTTDVPADEEPADIPAAPPSSVGRRLRLVGGCVLVLLIGAAVALGLQVRDTARTEDARRDALGAATLAVGEILSYDHRRIEQDIAEARAAATGRFLEQYSAATDDLVPQARAGMAVVTATAQAASVESAEAGEVVVLLFVDQLTVRQDQEQPRLDQNRVRLTMKEDGGRWLVADLEAL